MYELIREDIVLNLEARINSQCEGEGEGEGIGRGDAAGHGGSGDIGGRVGVGEREREYNGGYNAERKDLGCL